MHAVMKTQRIQLRKKKCQQCSAEVGELLTWSKERDSIQQPRRYSDSHSCQQIQPSQISAISNDEHVTQSVQLIFLFS